MQSKASKLPFCELGWRTLVKLSLVRKLTPSKYHLGSCICCFSRTSTSDCLYERIKVYLLCWLLKAGPWKPSSHFLCLQQAIKSFQLDHGKQSYCGKIYSTSFPFFLYYLDSVAMFIKKKKNPPALFSDQSKWEMKAHGNQINGMIFKAMWGLTSWIGKNKAPPISFCISFLGTDFVSLLMI